MRILSFLLVTLTALHAAARDLHASVDGTGDGSERSPMSLAAALAAAETGDHVLLQDGEWGDVRLSGAFDEATYVEPAPGHVPRLRTLEIRDARNLVVRDLSISLSYDDDYEVATIVTVQSSAPDVTVDGCDFC